MGLRWVRLGLVGAALGALLPACGGASSSSSRRGVENENEVPVLGQSPDSPANANAGPSSVDAGNVNGDEETTANSDGTDGDVEDADGEDTEGHCASAPGSEVDTATADDPTGSDDDVAAPTLEDGTSTSDSGASPNSEESPVSEDDSAGESVDEEDESDPGPGPGPTPRGTPAETRAALLVNETALCSGLEPDKLVVAGILEDELMLGNADGAFRRVGPVFGTTGLTLNMATSKDGEKVFIWAPAFAYRPTHFAVYDVATDELFSAELSEETREDAGPAFRDGVPSYAVPHATGVTLVRGDGSWANTDWQALVYDVVELDESGWFPVSPTFNAAYYDFEQGDTRLFSYDTRSDVSSFTMVDGKTYYLAVMDGADVFSLVEEGPSSVEVFDTTIATDVANDVFGAISTFIEVVEDVVIVRSEGYPRLVLNPKTREVRNTDYLVSYDFASLSLSLPWVLVNEAGRPTEVYDLWTGEGRTFDLDPATTSTYMIWAGDWFMGRDDDRPLWLLNARTGDFETIDLDESFESKVTWETCSQPLSVFDIQTFPKRDGTILTTLRDEFEAGAYQRRPGDDRWRRVGKGFTDVFQLTASQVWLPAVEVYGAPQEMVYDPNVGVCRGMGGGDYEDTDQTGLLTSADYQVVIPGEAPVVLERGVDGVLLHPSGVCMQVYRNGEGNEGVDLLTRARVRFDFEAITWL